jgi:uncharacterized hydrophobic protein (TIGR00271 family)
MATTYDAQPWSLVDRIMPPQQRKSAAELGEQLDLGRGDRVSKQSAFWLMLSLAAVIATAGIIEDSTATVIGAMIIAPLATPIMGMALGIAGADSRTVRHAAAYVGTGGIAVVLVGLCGSLVLPATENLLSNSQISGRTSPTLVDLVAAIATGFAGAIGLSRRDVSDVIPGVAVAISLVPPLAVVGICLGQGAPDLALGALVLFASNVIAMILAGTLVYAIVYRTDPSTAGVSASRRSRVALVAVLVLITVPLAANTVAAVLVARWTNTVDSAAKQWLADDPGSEVVDVTFDSRTAVIDVLSPNELPPTSTLIASLDGKIPSGVKVTINDVDGRTIDAGAVS